MLAGFFNQLAQKPKIIGRKAKPHTAQPNLIEIVLIKDHTHIARTRNAKVTGNLPTFVQGLAQGTYLLQGNPHRYIVPRKVRCAMFTAAYPAAMIKPRQYYNTVTHAARTPQPKSYACPATAGVVVELPTWARLQIGSFPPTTRSNRVVHQSNIAQSAFQGGLTANLPGGGCGVAKGRIKHCLWSQFTAINALHVTRALGREPFWARRGLFPNLRWQRDPYGVTDHGALSCRRHLSQFARAERPLRGDSVELMTC